MSVRFNRLFSAIPVAPVLAVLIGSRAMPQTVTVQQVVSRSFGAQGGIENLRAIRTRVVTGRAEVVGGIPAKFQSWAKAPAKLKTQWDAGVIKQVRAFDGTRGWEENASIRELTGHYLARIQKDAVFNSLLSYSEAGVSAELKGEEAVDGAKAYVIEFIPPSGLKELLYFDTATFLPVRSVRQFPYDEGVLSVVTNYGDYRTVGKVVLPFSINAQMPDLPILIAVDQYNLNVEIPDTLFENPLAKHAHERYEVTLATIPRNIHKETDSFWTQALVVGEGQQAVGTSVQTRAWPGGWERHWGIPMGPTESWLVDIVVNEKYGRPLDTVAATIQYYSAQELVETQHFSQKWLKSLRKFPVSRFAPQPEIFDIRHNCSVPAALEIDRMVYTLELVTPGGEKISKSLEIPVSYYQQRNKFIFPVKGKFIISGAHEYYTLGHVYEWSQHYAYDIEGVGPNLEYARNEAKTAEDYVGWGREVISPADGTVVYSRNDVPNTATPREYLKLPNPEFAICGNGIFIDHGDNEFSVLCHMQQGSVRVKKGDRVRQGQVIGLLGCSAAPGFAHLHYQLQSGPEFLKADGIPSKFENVRLLPALGKGRMKVLTPKRGIYMEAE